jgi:hypothetical protein
MFAASTWHPSGRYKCRAVASEQVHQRRRTLALAAAALVAVVVIALLISRIRADEETPKISGAPKDAVATITQFESALRTRDWPGICNRLYSADARRLAGGSRCPAALAQSAAEVRDPRVQIRSVVVRGQSATVTVAASVNGKPPVTDSILLVREGGRYRIQSAGGTAGG